MMASALRSLWPQIAPFKTRLVFGAFLIVLCTIVEISIPVIVGKAVDVAVETGASSDSLIRWCFLYLSLIVTKALLESAQAYTLQGTGHGITHELRRALFGKILTLKISYFDKNPTGRLLTRVINDIKSLGELFTASISVLALDAMIIIGTIAAMFWVNAWLALLVLSSFPLVIVAVHVFGKRLAGFYREVRARLAEINAFLGENIGALATVQRLSAEEARLTRFSAVVQTHQDAQMRSLKTYALVQPVTNVINGVAVAALLIGAGYEIVHDRMTVGILVAFLGYVRNLFQPIRDLVEKYNTFLSAGVSAERVAQIFAEESEPHGALEVPLVVGSAELEFRKVSFCYPIRLEAAVRDISFRVPAGSSLAVVGATGSGKSTLVRLLLRFYEPNEGAIYVAGRDAREYPLSELRRFFGVIHQEVYLFSANIRENLTLGKREFSDQYLIEQCRKAQVWDLLEARGGLEASVQENGTNFSLGERQLLSFARAMVFDPPVLILDEATASIDRILEQKIMDAISSTIKGRTSIIIAHRLSTIRTCDNVIVMENGRLVQQGSYDYLAQVAGVFRRFHELHQI